jgi:hypothetical protein
MITVIAKKQSLVRAERCAPTGVCASVHLCDVEQRERIRAIT